MDANNQTKVVLWSSPRRSLDRIASKQIQVAKHKYQLGGAPRVSSWGEAGIVARGYREDFAIAFMKMRRSIRHDGPGMAGSMTLPRICLRTRE